METRQKNNEVYIEETINADIRRVYEAWTNPEKLLQWYAPEGCTIRYKENNVSVGGKFHSCISNPTYGDCWCIGEYRDLTPYTKIVFTLINADENGHPINPVNAGMDPAWPGDTLVTVILSEERTGKTKLQLLQTVSQELAKKTGAYPSWIQMLQKLKSILK